MQFLSAKFMLKSKFKEKKKRGYYHMHLTDVHGDYKSITVTPSFCAFKQSKAKKIYPPPNLSSLYC